MITPAEVRRPKVSVAMLAYNHEEFIAQAIESVLMQDADFSFELVIGEDCSTDRTRHVVQEYASKNPDTIRALLHPKNMGMHQNAQAVRSACRGQYVACLEGDDYWTDRRKLQKQVEFLDSHPDCAICFHRVRIVQDCPEKEVGESPMLQHRVPLQPVDALLHDCFIYTCSVMFRQNSNHSLPPGSAELHMVDWPSFILMAMGGDIGYIDECMACYRLHPDGVWSGLRYHQKLRGEGQMLLWIAEHLPPRYRPTALANGNSRMRLARRAEIQETILNFYDRHERIKCWLAIVAALRRDPSIFLWRPYVSLVLRSLLGKHLVSRLKQWLKGA